MDKFTKLLKEIIIPSITVLTSVLVIYLNNSVSRVESKLQETKEERAARESRHNYDLKIYEKVVASLESDDPKKQKVAKALVVVMASDSFKVSLLNVLEDAGTKEVKEEVSKIIKKENQYRALSMAKEVSTDSGANKIKSNWRNYSYDIFWCEESGDEAKQLAKDVVKKLEENNVRGRIRVRPLPASINSRSGYQISGYVIRANKDELNEARSLAAEGKVLLGEDFLVTLSGSPTPSYISAFICP